MLKVAADFRGWPICPDDKEETSKEPTKFDVVINLVTTKAHGLTIPLMLLARIDQD
jgi:hypothetical protein